jgi:hypothetical protein
MLTTFAATYEIQTILRFEQEMCERFFPQVLYRKLTGYTDMDDVHLEVADENKIFAEDIPLFAYVSNEGERHPLTKYGLERVRETMLVVSTMHLVDAGLAEIIEIPNTFDIEIKLLTNPGDRFTYTRGVVYNINEWRRGPGFGNTDIPLYFEAPAVIWRPDSTEWNDQ